MSLKIVWSENAELSFKKIIEQIENKWSFKEASIFTKKANKVIINIPQHPYLYPKTQLPDSRKAVITKQTSVIYKIHEDYIEILFFWDNRQDPSF